MTQPKHTTGTQAVATRELVRLFTCGSVDDGKSTLIGRLFLDTNTVDDDVLVSLKKDSVRSGTAGDALDPALLTDGLQAEQEQGITIDVAYRTFETAGRRFLIADTPGHVQYTRNMVSAASLSNIAIILLDATKGVLEQTKRHSFIASLMGIKHVIVAVNKMDLVGFSEERFTAIRREYEEFASRLDTTDIHFVPICALGGDNVVEQSAAMPWYSGGTLLHLLETVHIASDRNHIDFRFPVQYVHRPNSTYRGYSGVIASGVVRPGDDVVVLPQKTRTRVQSIDTFDGPLDSAFAPMSVTLQLEGDHDVSRGCMIAPVQNLPKSATAFEATIVWMDDEPMQLDREYAIQQTTRTTQASVDSVRYIVNVDTLRQTEGRPLQCNDIGRCHVACREPLFFDTYKANRSTGSFLLIDRTTLRTVGAGMIIERRTDAPVEQGDAVSAIVPPIVWLTGNTGAGKTTLADGIAATWNAEQSSMPKIVVLDGDRMRASVSVDEDLSPEGRRRHNLRVARLALELQQQGFLVLVSVIAPFESVRSDITDICSPKWVYVQRLQQEDPDKPYEVPLEPDMTIDHDVRSVEQAHQDLEQQLQTWVRAV